MDLPGGREISQVKLIMENQLRVLTPLTTSFQAVLVILIQYYAIAQSKSALEASLTIIWLPLAAFVSSAASGILGDKINARYLVSLGMLLVGVGLLSLYILPSQASYIDTLWREIILGLGAGLCFTSIPNTALAGVPRAKLGAGNGAYTTFKQLGFVLGVAIFISLLIGQLKANTLTATQEGISYIQNYAALSATEKTSLISEVETGTIIKSSDSANGLTQAQNEVRPYLAKLFQTTTRDSFAFVWLVGGLLALVGVIPAMFTTSSTAEILG